ncbi:MAG: peptide chain release factor 1 [Candidatus Kerfeldbacteria bacterium]|nr:peptide chain release factor 1 [Candidatus Kerfeldbacteria bacterium]
MSIPRQQVDQLRRQYQQLADEVNDLSHGSDPARRRSVAKRYAQVAELVTKVEQLDELERQVSELRKTAAAGDPELAALVAEELPGIQDQLAHLERHLRAALQPADPFDGRDIIVEIRAGAGGHEAALFAAELFRMYSRFAERQGWTTSLLSSHQTTLGGFKEVIFEVTGDGVYRWMKYESGVHRVQRVPATEKSGRVHTSTVTTAVIPEAEEEELSIAPQDLKIETSTARGHGGQSVNTTYSAIRLTHVPTGIVVSMQDERSQTQNRLKAMRVLRARLLARQEAERLAQASALRKQQIGTGQRAEKIRTYNFPQNRVTDHRLKVTVHHLDRFLDGDLRPLLDQLRQVEQATAPRR